MSDDRVVALERRVEELTRSLEAMQVRLMSVATATNDVAEAAPVSRRHALRAAGVLAAGAIAGGIGALTTSTDAHATPTLTGINYFSETASGQAAVNASGSGSAWGVNASSVNAYAIVAQTSNGTALFASGSGSSETVSIRSMGSGAGMSVAAGTGNGISAQSSNGVGVSAHSINSWGVYASTAGSDSTSAIWGEATAARGVQGTSDTNIGVEGISNSYIGVAGTANAQYATGVLGQSDVGYGVNGSTSSGVGVRAYAVSGTALTATTATGAGIIATTGSATLPAIDATNTNGSGLNSIGIIGVNALGSANNDLPGIGIRSEGAGSDGTAVLAIGNDGVKISARRAALYIVRSNVADVHTLTPRPGELVYDTSGQLWFAATGARWTLLAGTNTGTAFTPISPARVYDSRAALPSQGVIANNSTRTVSLADGRDNTGAVNVSNLLPAGVRAVAANVTVAGTSGANFLCLNPGGITTRSASTINWFGSGQSLANGVVLTLNDSREITIVSGNQGGTAHVIIDISGYWR